jgi:hypothetical protein
VPKQVQANICEDEEKEFCQKSELELPCYVHSPPPASTARVCSSGPKSSTPSVNINSGSRVRARLTREFMVPKYVRPWFSERTAPVGVAGGFVGYHICREACP